MKPILSRSGFNIELNALFIQPTRWCGLNCKGCYVKEHTGGEDDPHVGWVELHKLFKLFYRGPHWANQITIAVDDLNNDPIKQRHMLNIVDAIFMTMEIDKRPAGERPEVHMTLHTPDTFFQYCNSHIWKWDRLSMVSFSELPKNGTTEQTLKAFKEWGVPINYNKTAPQRWYQHELQRLQWSVERTDHTYLVMHKLPVGSVDSASQVTEARDSWRNYQLYISEVVDKLPENVRRKVTIDGCISDTVKHSRTGFGCSSNVSRVQVWPDGSVSGCPYAVTGNTKIADTAESIVANIRTAREKYDFKERCHLPTVYSSLSRRSGLRIL